MGIGMDNLMEYQHPFRHWVIDNAFPYSLIEAALVEWPDESWQHWHKYSSAEAVKLGTRDTQRMPEACKELYNRLCCVDVTELLGELGVFPDFSGYGAGMHWIPNGGHLSVHRDANTHPTTGWRRRLSLCLYLDDQYEGGGLDLFEDKGKTLSTSIRPRPNRLVILDCSENAYHGVPDTVSEPGGRKSIAAFFWSRKPEIKAGWKSDPEGDPRTSAEFTDA